MKDERTRYETGNVQAVLDGDLDGFIEAYLQWRRQQAGDVSDAESPRTLTAGHQIREGPLLPSRRSS